MGIVGEGEWSGVGGEEESGRRRWREKEDSRKRRCREKEDSSRRR